MRSYTRAYATYITYDGKRQLPARANAKRVARFKYKHILMRAYMRSCRPASAYDEDDVEWLFLQKFAICMYLESDKSTRQYMRPIFGPNTCGPFY